MTSFAEEIQKIHEELNNFMLTEDNDDIDNLKEALEKTSIGLETCLKKPPAINVDK